MSSYLPYNPTASAIQPQPVQQSYPNQGYPTQGYVQYPQQGHPYGANGGYPANYPPSPATHDPLLQRPAAKQQDPRLLYQRAQPGTPVFVYGLADTPRIFAPQPRLVALLTQIKQSRDQHLYATGEEVWASLQTLLQVQNPNPIVTHLATVLSKRVPGLMELIAYIANIYLAQAAAARAPFFDSKHKAISSAIFGVAAELSHLEGIISLDPETHQQNVKGLLFLWANLGGFLVTPRFPLEADPRQAYHYLQALKLTPGQTPTAPIIPVAPPPPPAMERPNYHEQQGVYGLAGLYREKPVLKQENTYLGGLLTPKAVVNPPKPKVETYPLPKVELAPPPYLSLAERTILGTFRALNVLNKQKVKNDY